MTRFIAHPHVWLAFIVMAAASAGCSGPARTATGSRDVEAGLPPDQKIERLAQREQALPAGSIGGIALPPGVEPTALARRNVEDARAFRSLESVVSEYAQRTIDAPAIPNQVVDEERAAAAVRHYVKARNAALDGRNLQAIIEFQKARELDPNSAAILRELARIYIVENRTSQAMEVFEQLVALEPDNIDALFALGLGAASRRDFELAVAVLARLRLSAASRHDPASDILASFTLATALRDLGFDRAFIEAAKVAADVPDDLMDRANAARLASVYRQRGETWRSIGDAHCRLGEYEQALRAFAAAAVLPLADPASLHPRVIYANLCLGRPFNAQRELLQALKKQTTPSDRDIRLAAYLRENADSVEALAAAVADMHRRNPEDSSLMRAAAQLMPPPQARALLMQFISSRPRDLESVTQLLTWVAQHDVSEAVNLAATLAVEHPDLADDYAERLLLAVPRPSEALSALRGLPSSPAASHMEAKLLWKAGGLGEAWSVCARARAQWPEDRALALQQLLLAAALQESALFEKTLSSAPRLDAPAEVLALSQARRALAQFEPAVALAEQALSADPSHVEAMIESARAHVALAASLATDPSMPARTRFNEHIAAAAHHAERAIAATPQRDEPYEVLLHIYMPNGVRADTADYRTTMQRLREANPNSVLFARLSAQEALAQKRYEHALDRLLNLYENNPSDVSSLTLAVTAWQQWGRLDAAEKWLNERLVHRPGDAALREQWVRVQLLLNRSDAVMKKLESAVDADPNDYVSRRLLETVYRATGHFEASRELTEQRLLARPQGVRRELELAALYAGAELAAKSITHLEWILAHGSEANMDELAGALRVAARLQGDDARRHQLHLELAQAALNRFPEAPLQFYGAALLALARLDEMDDRFDDLAEKAANHSRSAMGESVKSAEHWREMAQALIDEGHPEAAARAVRARLQRGGPLDDDATVMLARTALLADAAADAEAHDPQHAQRSMELIRWLHEAGRLGRALEGEEAASMAGGFYEVSTYYTIVGSRDGANLLLREAIGLDPQHAMAMNNLGYAQLEMGRDDEETIEMIQRAYALAPEEPNVMDTAGWLRYKQGRVTDAEGEGALKLIEKSATSDSEPSPEVLDHLGDAQWRSGQRDLAMASWRATVKLLEDPAYEQFIVQRWQMLQTKGWQLLVFDPKALYDREYGPILARAKAKVAAVEAETPPAVAPTFEEMRR